MKKGIYVILGRIWFGLVLQTKGTKEADFPPQAQVNKWDGHKYSSHTYTYPILNLPV